MENDKDRHVEYVINATCEDYRYFELFGIEEGLQRLEAVGKNIVPIICANTGNNICILFSEAIQRALSLKKVIDQYNYDLLVPYPVSWITVSRLTTPMTFTVISKPIGNCGIIFERDSVHCDNFEGFTMFEVDDVFMCLEKRTFEINKIDDNRIIIREPIVLVLSFPSRKDQLDYPITGYVVRNDKTIELFCERLDATIIVNALKSTACSYRVLRKTEVLLSTNDDGSSSRVSTLSFNSETNSINKFAKPYCDLLDESLLQSLVRAKTN